MLVLLEEQVGQLNKDEKSLEGNLDFIGKSMDVILLSRKDTFKEQITKAYAQKENDLDYYKKRVEEMEANEELFQKSVRDRENLVMHNLQMEKEIDHIKESQIKESSVMRN